MKIKKYKENYKMDQEEGDIAEEYAKFILSEYLDKHIDGVTLEDVFRSVVDVDELDEDQEYIIKQELMDLSYNIVQGAKKIRKKLEIDTDKYNV